ncbi:MAG TPA: group III truncated hemoglobin [Vicinamibacterales bacterium]|nr:group III truncated hemoglobin [Vicinamibacterales bacterium]
MAQFSPAGPPSSGRHVKDDIGSRSDIICLVDEFYERVRQDDLIGPIFTDVARVDWSKHLPKMYAFWESILFGVAGFKGNPMIVHRALAQLTPLTSREFDRWIELFHATVDDLFQGPTAEDAKRRASMIAGTMLYHVGTSVPRTMSVRGVD